MTGDGIFGQRLLEADGKTLVSRSVLILAAMSAFAIAASCRGSSSQPLALEQRVIQAGDLPGFAPVLSPKATRLLQVFDDEVKFFPAPEHEKVLPHLFRSGFVSGVYEALFATTPEMESGSIAVQLSSEDEAKRIVAEAFEASLTPCPGACTIQFSEIDVPGIPDAKATARIRPENVAAAENPPLQPFDNYNVFFSDGSFAYAVMIIAPPGQLNKDDVINAAKRLYDRVKGSPLPP